MDTLYYRFHEETAKVSGGEDLATRSLEALPLPAEPAGVVVDFERGRRRLETQTAWRALAGAVDAAPQADGEEELFFAPPRSRRDHTSRLGRAAALAPRLPWRELAASGCTLLATIAMAAALFGLV